VVARLRAAGCVFAEDEAMLLLASAESPAELTRLVERRTAGEPLEHLVGWAEFAGHRVAVGPGVFVPRRRTELLVRCALAVLAGRAEPIMLDLCCGAGAIGVAVLAARPDVQLWSVDLDPAAVSCARGNLPGRPVLAGDLLAPIPARLLGQVAVLTANAPYVPAAAIALMPREARDHEARLALDGGVDGLGVVRRVLSGALAALAPDGSVLIEAGSGQLDAVVEYADSIGLTATVHTDPDLDAIAVECRRRSPNDAGCGC